MGCGGASREGGEPPRAVAADHRVANPHAIPRTMGRSNGGVTTGHGSGVNFAGVMAVGRDVPIAPPTRTQCQTRNRRGRCARSRDDAARWGHRALPQRDRTMARGDGVGRRDAAVGCGNGAVRTQRVAGSAHGHGRSGAAGAREAKPRTASRRGGAMGTSRPTAMPHGRCARPRDDAAR